MFFSVRTPPNCAPCQDNCAFSACLPHPTLLDILHALQRLAALRCCTRTHHFALHLRFARPRRHSEGGGRREGGGPIHNSIFLDIPHLQHTHYLHHPSTHATQCCCISPPLPLPYTLFTLFCLPPYLPYLALLCAMPWPLKPYLPHLPPTATHLPACLLLLT